MTTPATVLGSPPSSVRLLFRMAIALALAGAIPPDGLRGADAPQPASDRATAISARSRAAAAAGRFRTPAVGPAVETIRADYHGCFVMATGCNRMETSSFASEDCVDQGGAHVQLWTFTASAGQELTITMESEEVDSYLYLHDGTGTLLGSSGDGGGGRDARIDATVEVGGVHVIAATEESPATGVYSLAITCAGAGTPCPITSISCNQKAAGWLGVPDCMTHGAFFDRWAFAGLEGDRIVVTMGSTDFNPFVGLSDSEVPFVWAEGTDDGEDARLPYTLPRGGTWFIAAGQNGMGASGAYTIGLECTSAASACSPCVPSPTTACLLGNRFRVTLPRWRDPGANLSGQGSVIRYAENREEVHEQYGPLSAGTFFSMYTWAPASIEVIVRMIKGETFNDRFWIFATGFTGAEYTLRIEDTQTCATWERTIPAGATEVIKDFEAFPFP